jgi:cupin 2 domain-containing protein
MFAGYSGSVMSPRSISLWRPSFNGEKRSWVIVLRGAAWLRSEDAIVEMKPGDVMNIPAHKKHRVEWTTPDEPTIWLAVHYGDHG